MPTSPKVGATAGTTADGRRRSSASSGQFAGLMGQKRASQDASAEARKQSFAEMKPAGGVLHNLWSSVVKPTGSPK
ncbi:hypothetical protein MMC25_002847 [Agyrium rufum]|nr:hypothetical protein [Agyrium rufum]